MQVYHSPTEIGQLRTNKVRAASSLVGLPISYIIDTKPAILSKLFRPSFPILVTNKRAIICSSNNIMRYLANSYQKLYGDNIHEASEIDQWVDLISLKLEPSIETVLVSLKDKQLPVSQAINEANQFVKIIEKHLKDRKYLVSPELSIADVSLYTNLSVLFAYVYGESQIKQLPTIKNWFENVGSAIGTGLPAVVICKIPHYRFKNIYKQQSIFKKQQIIQQNPKVTQKMIPILVKEPIKQPNFSHSSNIILDVKIFESETDLKALAERIFKLEIDGIIWNHEYLILPVAYGINKLQINCTVKDKTDFFPNLEGAILQTQFDTVQSVDVVQMLIV